MVTQATVHKETVLWRERTLNDPDFARFSQVHTSIIPAVVWHVPKSRSELTDGDFVAQLWTLAPSELLSVCPECEGLITDKVRHIIADCPVNFLTKQCFLKDILQNVSQEVFSELSNCDSEHFVMKVFGGEIDPRLDKEAQHQYLKHAFHFVRLCFKTHI